MGMNMVSTNRSMSLGTAVALVAAQLAPLPALAPIGMAPALAQYGERSATVSCYSQGNGANSCRLPSNTVNVAYIGNDRDCREGDTWRRTGDSIQVRGGCGGNFRASYRGDGGNWGGGSGGGQGGNGGGNWGGGGGNNQGFAGEITCRSQNNREQSCSANTENRVRMLQQYSSSQCVEGRTWRYSRNAILVRDGCQARFGYGYGNSGGGGSGGGWGGGQGGGWGGGTGRGFAGDLECRSQDNRYRRCTVYTDNRVELLRQLSSTSCVRNRSWGYDRNSIWVDNGCQARFGYGYGNVSGDTSGGSSGGSNTGAIIGGTALAAGLIALLAASGKSSSKSASGAPATATVNADLSKFPSDARTPGKACLDEASRQIGATGGTAVRLDGIDSAQRSGEGWMILARMTGTYPDHTQKMTMDCRATGDKVTAFDVR